MYILGIETTGPICSVALFSEKNLILELKSNNERNHLKDLMPLIDEVLGKAKVDKREIDYIAVSIGPGSFTGIRIGVSTARALSQILNKPIIEVPTLDAFLENRAYFNIAEDEVIVGIINARRGQVYGIVEGLMEGCPTMIEDTLEVLLKQNKKAVFFGDGIDAYSDLIREKMGEEGDKYIFSPEENRYQRASLVASIALKKIEKGEVTTFENCFPDYMRRAEAEVKLEQGALPICKGPKQE